MIVQVVVIDDERAMRESVSQWLSLADCEVTSFSDGTLALSQIKPQFDGVVVTDLKMPALKRASEKRQLVLQNRQLRQRAESSRSLEERLLGECASVRKIRQDILQFAGVDVDVLIVGETGTGKEVVARALHDFGHRKMQSFKPLDCGALPQENIEQLLFGSVEATQPQGVFEQANGGTVFLDEVTNMPLAQQTKLLRVLEQREVQRVGEASPRSLDIRVVSAANASLDKCIADGQFRTDLFFRLNTLEIRMPALRDRDDDCVSMIGLAMCVN